MTRAVVVGYASMDYSMDISTFEGMGHTSLVSRPAQSPESGGIARVFSGLTAFDAAAVSWVGRDDASRQWTSALASSGVNVAAVEQLDGHMPTSWLFHSGSGGTLCFFDPGVPGGSDVSLSDAGKQAVAAADVVIIAIGPRHASEEAVAQVSEKATLVWIVKADPKSFPLEVRRSIVARADIIIQSHQEDDFVRECGPASRTPLVVRTAGGEAVHWSRGADSGSLPVMPVSGAVDATGAGDWFAGHFLGSYVDSGDLETSLSRGIDASREFLLHRTGNGG